MLKISGVYPIGNPEIPIHYTSLSQVEQALLKALILQIWSFDTRMYHSGLIKFGEIASNSGLHSLDGNFP